MNQTGQTTQYQAPVMLYATVTITGAAVMILELLGTRIIGPFYGVSLYVWSSQIAVTLIALALGYFLGGYLADRYQAIRLSHVILASALTTAAIPFLSGPVLRGTDSIGLRGGAFTSALLLFTLPLTALAMVGPYVIKRATRDLSGVGTTSGTVYAISTVGSVAGTLLLGFFLLPMFGTRAIIFSLSLILAMLAVLVTWYEARRADPSGPSSSPPYLSASQPHPVSPPLAIRSRDLRFNPKPKVSTDGCGSWTMIGMASGYSSPTLP